MYSWIYRTDGSLVKTNCPDLVLDTVFKRIGGTDAVLDYSSRHRRPLIVSNPLGLMWGVAFEYQESHLSSIHVFGPVSTADLAYESIREALNDSKVPTAWRPKLMNILNRIPVTSTIDFFKNVLMLHYCVTGEKLKSKKEAADLAGLCKGKPVTIQSVTQKEKSEAAPRLYDLTSLQREANTVLGYTAQQTLDYTQGLYEKKLCTYPRTGSRFLTDDMESRVPEIAAIAAKICEVPTPLAVNCEQVCDSRKVTDHYAIIPTLSCLDADLSLLPAGEREILKLIARSVLRAVSGPFQYTETEVTASCEGSNFTAKGKTITDPGWQRYLEKENEEPLPLFPIR